MGLKETFKALSDPVRRDILVLLREKRLSVGELLENFNISGGTLSYHLSILKKSGLIAEIKQKNFIYYEINTSVFEEVILWFSNFGGKDEKES